jgi:hypothetical protein
MDRVKEPIAGSIELLHRVEDALTPKPSTASHRN